MICVLLFLLFLLVICLVIYERNRKNAIESSTKPISVNYHFTRKCNYQCKFCFFTAKSSTVLPLEEAERGIVMLKESGMQKINFSGGEPFLYPDFLGKLVKYCKELGISTSIISNGSKIREKWLQKYGEYLDILAISCDSCNPDTLEEIGRGTNGEDHLDQIRRIRDWCKKYKILFKINSTVVKANLNEDLSEFINDMDPVRWKVFQCLLLKGENMGDGDLRDARSMTVTDEEFGRFVERHRGVKTMVVESNILMRDSYLILDPYMRFLNNETGERVATPSILDVGVEAAQKGSGFNEKLFLQRGGKYKWSKKEHELNW